METKKLNDDRFILSSHYKIIALFGLHIFTIYNNKKNKKTVFYGLIYSYIFIFNWIKHQMHVQG